MFGDQIRGLRELIANAARSITGRVTIRTGTATWDPASVADGAFATTTITVAGAALGDVCVVGFSLAVPAGVDIYGHVSAANTVTVTLSNESGGAVDLASGTLRAQVFRQV